jgi:dTDP-4-amino-4,6-dideoxygalactose transaminase
MQERRVKIFWPAIPDKEDILPEIEELLWPKDGDRPFVGEGVLVERFEQECMKKFGFDYVLFTNSGTSAMDLALLTSRIKAGDEIITSPMTCTATNTPLLIRQAKLVFADVEYDTANIDVKKTEEKITDKTKAIVVVHWGGYPCEMDEINEVAKKHNLPIIADGAHALGATYKGKPISKTADFTMFSLQAIKQMTTIDGGLLVISFNNSKEELVRVSQDSKNREILRDLYGRKVHEHFNNNLEADDVPSDYFVEEIFESIKERKSEFEIDSFEDLTKDYEEFKKFWLDWQRAESARRRRWFGIGREERIPNPKKGYSVYHTYEHGGKFQSNNFNAIIGLASLKKFDEWKEKRRRIAEKYNSELRNIPGVKIFRNDNDRQSGNWLYNLNVERRGDFVTMMEYRGIECSVVHERNDELPVFRKHKTECPNLAKLNEDRVCIPLHQNLTDEDVEYIIYCIRKGW